MMPHLERSIFPWNWAHYAEGRQDEVSPWIRAFENAYNWMKKKRNKKFVYNKKSPSNLLGLFLFIMRSYQDFVSFR